MLQVKAGLRPVPSYEQALKEILLLDRFGSLPGLGRIRKMLSLLGNPQKDYKCMLIGGSNGKGSTVEMAGRILSEEGFCVGTYFSPQLREFPDRIRINGKNAGKKEIAEAYSKVRAAVRRGRLQATFFEVVTAMAFLIFSKRKVDYAVLEVGLGGRLDATNAAEPEISAITSISLEHTGVLGKTVEKIAMEKAGIARKGKFLACGALPPAAAGAIRKHCKKTGAVTVFTQKEVQVSHLRRGSEGRHSFSASFRGKRYSVRLASPGAFQVKNACTALALCSLLGASKGAIEKGLAKARPAFRFQKLSSSPALIADCAHNPEAAAALAAEVKKMQKGKKVLLFSAMSDKDYASVLRILAPLFSAAVLTQVSLSRSAGLGELVSAAKKAGAKCAIAVKKPKAALVAAKKPAGKRGIVVVAGSIYLLSELFGRDKIRIAQ